jgi:hypothetical protein
VLGALGRQLTVLCGTRRKGILQNEVYVKKIMRFIFQTLYRNSSEMTESFLKRPGSI